MATQSSPSIGATRDFDGITKRWDGDRWVALSDNSQGSKVGKVGKMSRMPRMEPMPKMPRM